MQRLRFIKFGDTYEISAESRRKRGSKPGMSRCARVNPKTLTIEYIQTTGGAFADFQSIEVPCATYREATRKAIHFIREIGMH